MPATNKQHNCYSRPLHQQKLISLFRTYTQSTVISYKEVLQHVRKLAQENYFHNKTVKLLGKHKIKSRKSSQAGHIARMKEGRSAFKISTGTPEGRKETFRKGLGLIGSKYLSGS